jgi:hypothetical protein
MSTGQGLRLFPNTYSNDDQIDGVKEFDSNPYVPEKGKVKGKKKRQWTNRSRRII